MKLIINIATFVFVLLIPFALSSQTRKAIPAGRYEALSGIKVSRSSKGEVVAISSNQVNIWQEVQKNLPAEKNDFSYVKNYSQEINFSQLIPNKNFKEAKKLDQGFDFLVTTNLGKDKETLKHLRSKGLVMLISSTNIKELIGSFSSYELVAFVAQSSENYYLLKSK